MVSNAALLRYQIFWKLHVGKCTTMELKPGWSHNILLAKGSLNNYVDKMRGGGGQKMSVFVHAQGIKTVHAEGGVKKWQNSVHVVVEWPLNVFWLFENFDQPDEKSPELSERSTSLSFLSPKWHSFNREICGQTFITPLQDLLSTQYTNKSGKKLYSLPSLHVNQTIACKKLIARK